MKKSLLPVLTYSPAVLLLIYYLIGGISKFGSNEVIVLTVYLVLGTIANFSINSNHFIFSYLKQQDEDLTKNPETNQIASNVWREYITKKETTKAQLNISSFIEMFMSEYTIHNNTNIVQRMKLIHTYASISILVGVLGTFVGLVFSLAAINPENIDKSILNILSGVHTAFFTSIGGILFSIAINLHSKIRNSEHLLVQVMLKIENYITQKDQKTADYYVVEALGEVKEAIFNMGRAFLDVAGIAKEFKTATDNLNAFNNEFQQNTTAVSGLFGDMKVITKAFNKKANLIHDDFSKLFDYFQNQDEYYHAMKESFEQTIVELKSFAGYQSRNMDGIVKSNEKVQKLQETLFANVQQAVQHSYTEMHEFFQNTAGQISQIAAQSQSQGEFNTELAGAIHKQMEKNQASLLKQLHDLNDQNSKVNDSFMVAVNTLENYFTTNQWFEAISQELERLMKQNSDTFHSQSKLITQSISEDMKKLIQQNYAALQTQADMLTKTLQQYKEETGELSKQLGNMAYSDSSLQTSVDELTNTTNRLIDKLNQPMPQQAEKEPVVNG
ncbi:MotA/TolQ/ExbB proton channel family protein [Neobacillus dielmonensis]|uniref:MotA/TolQ/ExbB proton channel family protein n=1 Tax=Neobacillus dielmonensis TaxID=1347369 RepID=UPI0005AB7C3A|nr:MotA/TolQ/ExbB proton channel family protein [Neobacillus dielmonensis]